MATTRECSINRYYDPTTDQFLSIDPAVASTNQPYVYTNDNPLNATDPLGLRSTTRRLIVGNSLVTVTVDVSGQLSVRKGSISVGMDGVTYSLHGVSETVGIGKTSIMFAGTGMTLGENGATFSTTREYDVAYKNANLGVSVTISVSLMPLPPSNGLARTLVKAGVFGTVLVMVAKGVVCYYNNAACPTLWQTAGAK